MDSGDTVNYMTAEELQAWRDAFSSINEATLSSLDEQGLPATEIYQRALEIIGELKG